MVQLSHLYITIGRTKALTIWTFVGKVISLLFDTLSEFVIAYLPRSNRLLISCLQSPSAVILEPKKRKPVTTSSFSPSVCHEVMGPNAMILVFCCFFFFKYWTLSLIFHSLLSLLRGSLVLLRFLPLVLWSAYLRLLMSTSPINGEVYRWLHG